MIKVATVYRFGFSTGSTPSLDRRNKGVEADINVGITALRIVIGAIANGRVQEFKDLRTERMDRGGCVEGVSINFVRAVSKGARTIPAIPAADTTTARDVRGEGDDRISTPPAKLDDEDIWNERPGSGRAKRADRNDRANEVTVDDSIDRT